MNLRIPMLSCLSVILALNCFAQKKTPSARQFSKLDKTVDEILELTKCPGVAVAVVDQNGIRYAKGYGYRDVEGKKPVTENTVFAIGSSTKAFTAALIGQLQEEKLLEVDDPAADHHSKLSFSTSELTEEITIRDLLTHRTGLPRHDMTWNTFPNESRDELVERIQYLEPSIDHREGFQYNNLMYMALGAIVEDKLEQPWESAVQDQIFKPLNMNRTSVSWEEVAKQSDVALGYSVGRDKVIERDRHHFAALRPAGSINSSVTDLAAWVQLWINGGKHEGDEILSQGFVSQAMSPQQSTGGGLPGGKNPDLHFSSYGFGWFISSYRGHYRVEHGGNIDGFTASVAFYPSDSIGVIVLANENYSSIPPLVRNLFVDKALGLSYRQWHERLIKANKEKEDEEDEESGIPARSVVKGTKPSHSVSDFAGKFEHKGYGVISVEAKEDTLFAKTGTETFWLRHHHYDVFVPVVTKDGKIDTTTEGTFLFNFQSNLDGEINAIEIITESSVDPQLFERKLEKLELNDEILAQYVGDYDLGGSLTKVTLKEGKLHIFIPGFDDYELYPVSNVKFLFTEMEGVAIQFNQVDGTTESLILIQPNGSYTLPKK